MKRGHRQPVDM